jgi:stage II sporulation protein AB (anti-sigma F factor)
MKTNNKMVLSFKALSVNESFARSTVAAFVATLNPTLDEITDIKTAVSEAVTNCVVHAYPKKAGEVSIEVKLAGDMVYIAVSDRGIGISDFEKAKEPFFTTRKKDERSGMGFTVMESFMDRVELEKNKTKGVIIRLEKKLGKVNYRVVGG